jgi:para-nitrobenzyl esterase
MRWLLLLLLSSAFAHPVTLHTPQGNIEGRLEASKGVIAFLGIPYAQAGRFRAPHPVLRWKGTLKAFHYGPACPQTPSEADFLGGSIPPIGENCLVLNVWTPVGPPPPGGWPVLFFLHGGGFADGSAAQPLYDGAKLASGGVVVVSANYRLGILGFLALPSLQAESRHHTTGNYGLLDQIAALRWVQRNIRAYGGNPKRVTLFGQSAGAMSVCDLMASPLARGLFAQAIMESGGCSYVIPLKEGFQEGLAIAKALSCPGGDPACLRKLPLSKLYPPFQLSLSDLRARSFLESPFLPHLDGYVLTQDPLKALEEGKAAGIPLIAGANANELEPLALTGPITWAAFRQRVEAILKGQGSAVVAYYQRHQPSPEQAWAAFETDRVLLCPTYQAAQAQSRWAPTWAYLFVYRSPIAPELGSFHGLELPLLFGTQLRWPAWLLFSTPSAYRSSLIPARVLRTNWRGFARTGHPTLRWPRWPLYASGQVLRIGRRIGLLPDPAASACRFFAP